MQDAKEEISVRVLAATLLIALSGCAETYPQGTVKTGDQAISMAQHACPETWKDVPGHWHAKLERTAHGIDWFVWKGRDYRVQVNIDAATGRGADACILPG